ncbi:MAG: hypothetical protein ACLTW6_06650 [Enterobacter sp.]
MKGVSSCSCADDLQHGQPPYSSFLPDVSRAFFDAQRGADHDAVAAISALWHPLPLMEVINTVVRVRLEQRGQTRR